MDSRMYSFQDIPERFETLKDAALHTFRVHCKIDTQRALREQEPRKRTGTELAGLMMANDLLTLEERESIRRAVEAEVHQAAWKHALDVVYG